MITINNLYKSFGKKDGKTEALRGISLAIKRGDMVAVMGKSGSGKSTLLKSQKELTRFRRDEIGFVVQYFALVEDMNIFQNVSLPLKYQGYSSRKIRQMTNNVLEELEIADKAKAYPCELSGGQQQRAAIARAVIKGPQVILADEPTGALDEATGNDVLRLFDSLHEKGRTIIIVTHDEKVAKRCRRIINIKDGKETDAGGSI